MKVVETHPERDGQTCVGKSFVCNNKAHRFKVSIAKDTWFERHNIPMEDVLFITFAFCKGLTYEETIDERIRPDGSKLSSETIADIFMFCREVIVIRLEHIFADEGKLGGGGKEVQIDEMKFGRWKYHRGSFVDGKWIFGAIEVESNRLRVAIIPDNKRDSATMMHLLESFVEKDSVIVSDKATFYNRIVERGFQEHHSVNHSIEFVNEDGFHTNNIESQWRVLRLKVGVGRIQDTLDYHLCEFLWRRKCRDDKLDVFISLLDAIKQVYRAGSPMGL